MELTDMGKATLSRLLELGEGTRRKLATDVGISFPTTTVALAELTGAGLVSELRREQGERGRATIVYGIARDAGWTLGVDIGSTQISFVARRLNGETLERHSFAHDGGHIEAGSLAGASADAVIARYSRDSPLLATAIALNQVVPRNFHKADAHWPLGRKIIEAFFAAAPLAGKKPILVENNVNCAAVAEHQNGQMKGHDDAVFMQIGVGLGIGFFCDGMLIRGAHGASGELAQIPLSWGAEVASPRHAIEHRYGSAGLMTKVADGWPEDQPRPRSAEELIRLGAQGDMTAARLIRNHAVALGRIAAAAATVLDPSVLVLGGGLASNSFFAELISEEFQSRNRWTAILVSQTGTDATVEGAVILARDLALRTLLGHHHRPLLGKPTAWWPETAETLDPGT